MQYLLILQKFTILELEVAVVVVGDRFLQLKEASEETDLGKEYLTETIGKIYKNEFDTVKSKEVCNRAVLLKSISVGGVAHRPEFQPNYKLEVGRYKDDSEVRGLCDNDCQAPFIVQKSMLL